MAFVTVCGLGVMTVFAGRPVGNSRRCSKLPLDVVTSWFKRVWQNSTYPSHLITRYAQTSRQTNQGGIPVNPTWSVKELFSSYSKPTISPATLKHLRTLSALIPPEEGSPEDAKLMEDMRDLVGLAEAVKLVTTDYVDDGNGIPDGRV